MKRKVVNNRADKVYGVKAVIDCTTLPEGIDKDMVFRFIKARALRCVWSGLNTIVEYEEDSSYVRDYWEAFQQIHKRKCYNYKIIPNVKLIDYIPDFEKIFERWREIANSAKESDEVECERQVSRSTIYDRVFSTTTYRAD